jgi:hypothetical protein
MSGWQGDKCDADVDECVVFFIFFTGKSEIKN